MLSALVVFEYVLIAQSVSQDIRSIELSEIINVKYQCNSVGCSSPIILFATNLKDCQFGCLDEPQCRTVSFYQSMNRCELYIDGPDQYGALLNEAGVVTVIVIDDRQPFTRKY